jgi:hypothetical protein
MTRRNKVALGVATLLLAALPGFVRADTVTGPWSSWSAWRYVAAPARECNTILRRSPGRWDDWPGCRIAVRHKSRPIVDWSNRWEFDETWVQVSGPFHWWWGKTIAEYRYNGTNVYTDGNVQCDRFAAGFEIKDFKCNIWNEGGKNWGYMKVGQSFTLHAIADGIPLVWGHGSNIKINANGIDHSPRAW